MVIIQKYTPKDGRMQENMILNIDIRANDPNERITMTPSGGFLLDVKRWDEFGNEEQIKVLVERSDVDEIKNMIEKNLL